MTYADITTRVGALRSFAAAVKGGTNATKAVAFVLNDMIQAENAGHGSDWTHLKNMLAACQKGDTYQTRLVKVLVKTFGADTKIKMKYNKDTKRVDVTIDNAGDINTDWVALFSALAIADASFVGPKVGELLGDKKVAATYEERVAALAVEINKLISSPLAAGKTSTQVIDDVRQAMVTPVVSGSSIEEVKAQLAELMAA